MGGDGLVGDDRSSRVRLRYAYGKTASPRNLETAHSGKPLIDNRKASRAKYRIGVDVGGTFTDFLLIADEGKSRAFKTPSTPHDPAEAVLDGLAEIAADLGLPDFLERVERIVHGTTVATNAILTGAAARTGLLTTHGFRDALQMRRGIREERYDNKYTAPEPIVPRWLRLPARERIDHRGKEVAPLSLEDVEAAARLFDDAGVEAAAICFMHAYANNAHERAAADRLRELLPELYISISSEVLPQVRFYERISTTVLNAAVGPILKAYIDRLETRLGQAGFAGALWIMQSNGGVCAPEAAARRPAHALLSGPAAGPIAGLSCAGRRNEDSFITIDMGGTSFEACLVRDGAPTITTDAAVGRFAMALPSLDIKSIGAGGGSIAWIDNGGLLHMGPQSAGARPGPACYGLGGTEPTCSDANLLLGYLPTGLFAGGRLPLDAARARNAIEKRIAIPLGCDATEAAAGMYRILNTAMAAAIREISVERGVDPRDFPMICAGGAGALHAAMIAREIGIRQVLVPRDASVFCAAGMMHADLRHDFVRSCTAPLADGALDRLPILMAEMENEGRLALAGMTEIRFDHTLDLRYVGQYHEVRVDRIPEEAIKGPEPEIIRKLFHRTHERLYGYALEDAPVELINARLAAAGITEKPAPTGKPEAGDDPERAFRERRRIFLPEGRRFSEAPVYDGDRLSHGNRLTGPAVVETAATTILVPEDFVLFVDRFGTSVLTDESRSAGP